jgi:rod shape-determining protein MreC
MISFLRKNHLLVGSLFSLFCSITLLAALATGRLRFDPAAMLILDFMRPFQKGAQATVSWVVGFRERYITMWGLREENERLKRRVLELESERNRFLEAEATNSRLRALLELKSGLPVASVTAAVIGNSASGWFRSITIDKGSQDGIRKGMAVVTPLGVVGQVVTAAPRSSKVLLLTDQNSAVDVVNQRSRTQGIVSGSFENGAVMKYVKRSEDIQVGDRLITSGLDGVYPKGLSVAVVSKVSKKGHGLFQVVEVTLAATPSRIEEVQVISLPKSRSD